MTDIQNGMRRRSRPSKLPTLMIDTKLTTQLPPSFGTSPGNTSPTQIYDGSNVFLGAEADACNVQFLKENAITKVLTIQCKPLANKFKRGDIEYEFIQASDNAATDLKQYFHEAYEFLDSNYTGSTLVHCQQGISRSSTICLAFLMKKMKLNFDTCFRMLRLKRNCVSPNFAFLGQLKCWETELGLFSCSKQQQNQNETLVSFRRPCILEPQRAASPIPVVAR